MISRFNWFIIICSIATITASINPSLYHAIAILFLGFSSVVLLLSNLKKKSSNWQIKRGIKETIVLVSLIVICLIIPQVETDLTKFSVSVIPQTKS